MPPPRIPVPFDDVFTTADLDRVGVTSGALLGWRARHEVIELNAGVYVRSDADRIDERRRIFASRAIAGGQRPVTVEGAALLHGLALPLELHASARRDDRHRVVPEDVVMRVHGLLVPTLEWTAVHIARYQPLEQALIPLDAALRIGASQVALLRIAQSLRGAPGTAVLMDSIGAADGRSESPLESVSRGLMVHAGIPNPELQYEIRTRIGRFRADFCWPGARLIGEADGRVKYETTSSLWQEKRREDALRAQGWRIERWVWDDAVRAPQAWLRRLSCRLRTAV